MTIATAVDQGIRLDAATERFRLAMVVEAVKVEGNGLRAAERLGVHRNTLSRILVQNGLKVDEIRRQNGMR